MTRSCKRHASHERFSSNANGTETFAPGLPGSGYGLLSLEILRACNEAMYSAAMSFLDGNPILAYPLLFFQLNPFISPVIQLFPEKESDCKWLQKCLRKQTLLSEKTPSNIVPVAWRGCTLRSKSILKREEVLSNFGSRFHVYRKILLCIT